MAKLRAFKRNGGKITDLLRYQKNKSAKEERINRQEELIKELRKRQSGWDYAARLSTEIPGIEQHSMKWMRNLIWHALG